MAQCPESCQADKRLYVKAEKMGPNYVWEKNGNSTTTKNGKIISNCWYFVADVLKDICGHTPGFIDNHEIFLQHATMARLSRIVVPGYPHHVTQRGVRSMNVFHEESDRREYLGMLGEEIARHGVSVLVWCLMTNHVHFVAVPHREDSLARGFGRAHWRYTRMKNFAAGVRGYLFQGRFNSCVLDESHLWRQHVMWNRIQYGPV